MGFVSNNLVSSLCIGTTSFFVMFWVALAPVEVDIVNDINWYIFTNLHLLQMKSYHLIFKYFSYYIYTLPLVILIVVYKSQLQRSAARLAMAVEFLILTVNFALLMFLFFKAWKMLYLLKLYLLYLAVTLASSNIIITPQILIGVDCTVLPAKPLLTAHRGCKDNYPENSISAFEGTSSTIDSVTTLETDVHISYDGIPFLLHDNTLARTTDITSKCPNLSPLIPASLLNYSTPGSSCNLDQLKITEKPVSPLQVIPSVKETIPTLRDFLQIAKTKQKSVIFDIIEPQNPNHPYQEEFIKLITNAIKVSKIPEEKVWWLYKEGRPHMMEIFPKMVQTTKSKETPFEEFKQNNITIVNDEWTIPAHLIKKYHSVGLSLNVWVINSRPLFEIFWCHGVKSITTNDCDYINRINTNSYHKAYTKLYNSSDAIGLYIALFVFLMLYLKEDSRSGLSWRLSSRYCVPIAIVTLIHIAFLYIDAL